MADLDLPSGRYRVGKFPNAITQLQVARRLAPVFVKMAPMIEAIDQMLSSDPDRADVSLGELMRDFGPFAEALSAMDDDKFEYVLNACLDATHRESGAGGGYAPVRRNGVTQFNDIPAPDLLQIAFAAIQENLSSFTTGPR